MDEQQQQAGQAAKVVGKGVDTLLLNVYYLDCSRSGFREERAMLWLTRTFRAKQRKKAPVKK